MFVVALAAACTQTATISGKAPENPREAGSDPAGPDGRSADPAQPVEGVVATRTYHRPDCPQLTDVPPAQRMQFSSAWDGLNQRYGPCEHCRPGP